MHQLDRLVSLDSCDRWAGAKAAAVREELTPNEPGAVPPPGQEDPEHVDLETVSMDFVRNGCNHD